MADVIHDVYLSVKGKSLSSDEIKELSKKIPKYILDIGNTWGWNDTVFKDELYTWLETI